MRRLGTADDADFAENTLIIRWKWLIDQRVRKDSLRTVATMRS